VAVQVQKSLRRFRRNKSNYTLAEFSRGEV
jgi:hypothetical protein